jgi:predicted amidohydrolase
MPKIAVAQIEIHDELDKNVKTILHFIEEAALNNADIICFPESCLGERFVNLEYSKDIQEIRKKCRDKLIYAIVGVHIEESDKIFNSAILIDRSGNIQYVYKKRHLFPHLDLQETSPGRTNAVIETDFGKMGIIICWDFAFPEDIRELSRNGAQIIFCLSYLLRQSGISKEVIRSYPLVRAFENLCYFVSCDAFTDEVFSESYICNPSKIINRIENKEGIIFADLDFQDIDFLRHIYNCLE